MLEAQLHWQSSSIIYNDVQQPPMAETTILQLNDKGNPKTGIDDITTEVVTDQKWLP